MASCGVSQRFAGQRGTLVWVVYRSLGSLVSVVLGFARARAPQLSGQAKIMRYPLDPSTNLVMDE